MADQRTHPRPRHASRSSRTPSSTSSTRWRSRSSAPATRSSSTRGTSPPRCAIANGNTVMQGSGTSPRTSARCTTRRKAVIKDFGDDIHAGRRVRRQRRVPGRHALQRHAHRPPDLLRRRMLGFSQANGHWADVGGAVPGSFDVERDRPLRPKACASRPCASWSKGQYAATTWSR